MNVMKPEPEARPAPIMSERRVGVLSSIIVVMGPLSLTFFTPAMPTLVHVFHSTESTVKMTLALYFAGFAIAQLICGPLSDGLGRKPVLLIFTSIYVIAGLAALLSPNIELLLAARFLQGVGAAAGMATSRALVRDLYTGEASARIMNMISILMGLVPALAPTVGGIAMMLFGWHSIFLIMVATGIGIIAAVSLYLVETVERDLSRIRPAVLFRSYRILLLHPYFLSSTLIMAGALGALYTQTTLLPFILMTRVGLSPAEYGFGMLLHSGAFLLGSLATRLMMERFSAFALVPVGLVCIGLGSMLTATILHIWEPTYLRVMIPIGIYTFGIPIVMPALSTAAMAPFPGMAGAASAMMGFLQMFFGLLGGLVSTLFIDQVFALTVVIPVFGLAAITSFLVWRRLPDPVISPVQTVATPGAG